MAEHVPPRALVALLSLFLAIMSGSALIFWTVALVLPGGVRALMAGLGPGATSLFAALHIPAMITGVLLWQWKRHALGTVARVALEAAILYFGLSVLIGLFFNLLAASLLDRML